jgi:hypothetical protein
VGAHRRRVVAPNIRATTMVELHFSFCNCNYMCNILQLIMLILENGFMHVVAAQKVVVNDVLGSLKILIWFQHKKLLQIMYCIH